MRTIDLFLYSELTAEAKQTADIDIAAYSAEFDISKEDISDIYTTYDFFISGEIYRGLY